MSSFRSAFSVRFSRQRSKRSRSCSTRSETFWATSTVLLFDLVRQLPGCGDQLVQAGKLLSLPLLHLGDLPLGLLLPMLDHLVAGSGAALAARPVAPAARPRGHASARASASLPASNFGSTQLRQILPSLVGPGTWIQTLLLAVPLHGRVHHLAPTSRAPPWASRGRSSPGLSSLRCA